MAKIVPEAIAWAAQEETPRMAFISERKRSLNGQFGSPRTAAYFAWRAVMS
jgi:hypothetical protein